MAGEANGLVEVDSEQWDMMESLIRSQTNKEKLKAKL